MIIILCNMHAIRHIWHYIKEFDDHMKGNQARKGGGTTLWGNTELPIPNLKICLIASTESTVDCDCIVISHVHCQLHNTLN